MIRTIVKDTGAVITATAGGAKTLRALQRQYLSFVLLSVDVVLSFSHG